MRHVVSQAGLSHAFEIDSAGTHNYHPAAAPDVCFGLLPDLPCFLCCLFPPMNNSMNMYYY